jgi:Acyltransferase family
VGHPDRGFNEPFFMSLMFLLSGLFVWQSIGRKGVRTFLQQRALRLGGPFVVASVLAPLAYYPAYLQTTARATHSFWPQWMSLGVWYSGPVWFVWVLLVFDCAAAALITYLPTAAMAWRALWARASGNGLTFFLSWMTALLLRSNRAIRRVI